MRNFLLFTFISTALFINAQKVAFIGDAADVASIAEADTKAAAELIQTTYGADFKYINLNNLVAPVPSSRTKVAFIGDAADVSSITEADTKAAAELIQSTYGADFTYIKLSDLTSGSTILDEVASAIFYYDNTGSYDLPGGGAVPADAITELSDFVKAGGGLLLGGFATQLIDDLGRSTIEPGIKGNGAGGDNQDVWAINHSEGLPTDVTNHAIYQNLTINSSGDFDVIDLIGPGHKEDHNSMWDLNATSYGGGVTTGGPAFEAGETATILATWGHVTDLCCAAVIEFKPVGDFTGTIIAIGPAAYEFTVSDNGDGSGTNPHQSNVNGLTTNALDYLKSQTLGVNVIKSFDLTIYPNPVQNTLFISGLDDVTSYSVFDITGKELLRGNTTNSVDVQLLNSGLYLLKVHTNNQSSTVKFLKR